MLYPSFWGLSGVLEQTIRGSLWLIKPRSKPIEMLKKSSSATLWERLTGMRKIIQRELVGELIVYSNVLSVEEACLQISNRKCGPEDQ